MFLFRHCRRGMLLLLQLLLGSADSRQLAINDGRVVYELTVSEPIGASCTPGAWVDFELTVTEALEGSNLMFEVEDKGEANNPEALYVALWEGAVPSGRTAEQYAALGPRTSAHWRLTWRVPVLVAASPTAPAASSGR